MKKIWGAMSRYSSVTGTNLLYLILMYICFLGVNVAEPTTMWRNVWKLSFVHYLLFCSNLMDYLIKLVRLHFYVIGISYNKSYFTCIWVVLSRFKNIMSTLKIFYKGYYWRHEDCTKKQMWKVENCCLNTWRDTCFYWDLMRLNTSWSIEFCKF